MSYDVLILLPPPGGAVGKRKWVGSKRRDWRRVMADVERVLTMDPTLTLRGILDNLPPGSQMCISQLNRVLKIHGWCCKLLQYIPANRNSEPVLNERRQFALGMCLGRWGEYSHFPFAAMGPVRDRHFVYVDECGFSLHCCERYGS